MIRSCASILILCLGLGAQPPRQHLDLEMILKQPGRFFPRGRPGLAWKPSGLAFSWVGVVGGSKPRRLALLSESVEGGKPQVVIGLDDLTRVLSGLGAGKLGSRDLLALSWEGEKTLALQRGSSHYRIRLDPLAAERRVELPEGAESVHFSPDRSQIAFVKDHDFHVMTRDGVIHQLTRDGSDDIHYGVAVSRSEFGISDGIWWSPDGRRIALYREDLRPIAPYPYTDFETVPAKAKRGRYPMAGRKGSVVQVGVVDTENLNLHWLETEAWKDEYLACITWDPMGLKLAIAHINRGQNHMVLREWDAVGENPSVVLLEEKNDRWIEPEVGPIYLPDGSGRFLWASFVGNWRHLQLRTAGGELLRDLTPGAYDVDSFRSFTPDGSAFFFDSSGPDPRQHHLFRASLSGGLMRVTPEGGYHETLIAATGAHILDRHSSLKVPESVTLRSVSQSSPPRTLSRSRNPFAGFQVADHRFFEAKTQKGDQTLFGHIFLPPASEKKTKAPVIQYVYGGPHSQLVQDRWLGSPSRWVLWQMFMASRGYVVFRVDGRGTNNRGLKWRQAVHRQLGTLELSDQLQGLDAALKISGGDPSSVGVHGWSFGGFMTLTMMTKGERYRVGVAGAPVTDWRFYETGYGERYMDTPKENPKGYRESDPSNFVRGLRGRKLLVVHPLADTTVMWQNSVHFLRECIDAEIPVDFMTYPEQLHGIRGKSYEHFLRKMTSYFDTNLAPVSR